MRLLKRSLPRDSTVNLYTAAVAADVMTEVARAAAMEKADATATVMTTKAAAAKATKAVAAVINGDEDCSSHT